MIWSLVKEVFIAKVVKLRKWLSSTCLEDSVLAWEDFTGKMCKPASLLKRSITCIRTMFITTTYYQTGLNSLFCSLATISRKFSFKEQYFILIVSKISFQNVLLECFVFTWLSYSLLQYTSYRITCYLTIVILLSEPLRLDGHHYWCKLI